MNSKFRAWHNSTERFLEGFCIDSDGMVFTFCEETGVVEVMDAELEEFTGLQDSKGNDIYFGDVVYIAGYGNLHVEGIGDICILVDAMAENDIGEILGNIHESPALKEQ